MSITCQWILRLILFTLSSANSLGELFESELQSKVKNISDTHNKLLGSQLQRCVTNEGRTGFCKTGICLNLIDKKPIYCQTSTGFFQKCCPTTARGAVLLPNEPSKSLSVGPNKWVFFAGKPQPIPSLQTSTNKSIFGLIEDKSKVSFRIRTHNS